VIAIFRVTPRAEEDLINIGRYTMQQWGIEQRDKYLRELDGRFQWLADNPKLGKARLDIEEGYYCYLQGSHLIFYQIQSQCIDILGVPHKSMDLINYFEVLD
jgi:toxin ParE1/3/4